MVNDVLAIVLATAGALALTWAVVEVRAYTTARRGHGPGTPGRARLRAAVFSGLTVVGGLLGVALGAWLGR